MSLTCTLIYVISEKAGLASDDLNELVYGCLLVVLIDQVGSVPERHLNILFRMLQEVVIRHGQRVVHLGAVILIMRKLIQQSLQQAAVPKKGELIANYMKNVLPFRGLQQPAIAEVFK